jgi:hypothetical protein
MKDLTKSEVQESWRIIAICILKGPIQGFSSVPVESVLVLYCNIEVFLSFVASDLLNRGGPGAGDLAEVVDGRIQFARFQIGMGRTP